MPSTYSLQLRSANSLARDMVECTVHARRDDARHFLSTMEHGIQQGIDANVPSDFLLDVARGLRDAISNIVGGLKRDLDNAALVASSADIDTADLDALIAQLERAASLAQRKGY